MHMQVQPTVYFEGMDPAKESASLYMESTEKAVQGVNPAVAIATTAGVGALAVAGTAVCIYFENLALLGVFWAVLGGAGAYVAYRYINSRDAATGSQ
jgi:cobalamin biosynthesis protein CobD/CbiB